MQLPEKEASEEAQAAQRMLEGELHRDSEGNDQAPTRTSHLQLNN